MPALPTSGVDFLQLIPPTAGTTGLTSWLVGALRAAIADGRLPAASVMPASRVLAAGLRISRGVVVEAYQRLADEGLIGARQGSGTRVLPDHRSAAGLKPIAAAHSTTLVPLSATRGTSSMPRQPPTPTEPALPLPGRQRWPGIEIDLSPGVPDLSAFPRAAWLRAERDGLAAADTADLGYGDPLGHPALRGELAGWLTRTRGLRAGADQIVIVAGVAQSLALLAQVLRSRGMTAIGVEDPGSRGARDQLGHWGLRPVPVPVDQDGMLVDDLGRSELTAAVLTPAHQFPTGVVLAPHRRREVLRWASERGGLVVEDDYDAEYRYDRAPVPALQASAPDRVAYTGSISKTLAPGMRLGWLVAPAELHQELSAAKHANDLGCPVIPQLALALMLATGGYDRHIRLVRNRQRQRRDALLAAVREYLPGAHIQGIAAGLHVVVTLPELGDDVDDVEMAHRISAAGVLVHPLSWHRHRSGPPGLVIGYAAHPAGRLREAARRMGQVLVGTRR